jgi:hypothetical protein
MLQPLHIFRAAIVHAGAVADARFVRQVAGAQPRDVKTDVVEGEILVFAPSDVETIASNMVEFVGVVANQLAS